VQRLYVQGARKFLLLDVPAIGDTPAVGILNNMYPGTADAANYLTDIFNAGLADLQVFLKQSLPEVDVRTLDLNMLLSEIIDDPASFGISNTEDACVTPNVPPFTCKKPDTYIFWDGIHPTKAVHNIMAQRAAKELMSQ
jgi:outer membrane lipase/esterase